MAAGRGKNGHQGSKEKGGKSSKMAAGRGENGHQLEKSCEKKMAAGRGMDGHQLGNSHERQGVSFVFGLFISRPQGYWARGYTSVARYIRASLLSHILLPLSILLGFWKDGEKRTGVPKKMRCYLGAAHFLYALFPGEDLFLPFYHCLYFLTFFH